MTDHTIDGIMRLSVSDCSNQQLDEQLNYKLDETINACLNVQNTPEKQKKTKTQSYIGAKPADKYRNRHDSYKQVHTPAKSIFSGVYFSGNEDDDDTLHQKIEELEGELAVTKNELSVTKKDLADTKKDLADTNKHLSEQAKLIMCMNRDMKDMKSKMIDVESGHRNALLDLNDSFIEGLPADIGEDLGDLEYEIDDIGPTMETGVSAAIFSGKMLRNVDEDLAAHKIQNAWKQSSAVNRTLSPPKQVEPTLDGADDTTDEVEYQSEEAFDEDMDKAVEYESLKAAGYFVPQKQHKTRTCFECNRSGHTKHWRKHKSEGDWCNACATRAKRKAGDWVDSNVTKKIKEN